jgi:hypothetical protein
LARDVESGVDVASTAPIASGSTEPSIRPTVRVRAGAATTAVHIRGPRMVRWCRVASETVHFTAFSAACGSAPLKIQATLLRHSTIRVNGYDEGRCGDGTKPSPNCQCPVTLSPARALLEALSPACSQPEVRRRPWVNCSLLLRLPVAEHWHWP